VKEEDATTATQDVQESSGTTAAHVPFSTELRELIASFGDEPVELEAILNRTQGRGIHLLLVIVALPFLTPIPLPGFSIPFGMVVALIGTRFALGKKPWLPQRLLRRKLQPEFLRKVVRAATRVLKVLEWFLRPRMTFMQEHLVFRRLAGVLLAISGLMMLAPLPLPFTNGLPAWTVLLLAAGALERDGLFFIAGCIAFSIALSYFGLLAFGGAEAVERLLRMVNRS
jgi:hypothetical protein